MVINIRRWREGKYTEKLESWMRIQKRQRIYELGSLPPFLLVFAGDVRGVEHRPVSLLHWSGKGKPWLRLDSRRLCPLDSLWVPYAVLVVGAEQREHREEERDGEEEEEEERERRRREREYSSVSWDKCLKVWRALDLCCLEFVKAHKDAINAVAVSVDGTIYTAGADRRRVWGRTSGETRRRASEREGEEEEERERARAREM
uniref:Hexosyltransferase n=1 Tax=Nelumbo nucifera TaxID=4432 RepID=A0A822YRV7_NELNU|nr:TPA_asm: hypothetical protein HUJ06_005890 [Nelumbo nucifera]